ncbi:TPA: hypothetical protein ACH3X3_006518 [Trebouxia sp. C0006]
MLTWMLRWSTRGSWQNWKVHQLRERMLQQAATYVSSSGAPAPAPESSPKPAGTTGANSGGAESSSRSTGGVSSETSSVSGGTGSGGI